VRRSPPFTYSGPLAPKSTPAQQHAFKVYEHLRDSQACKGDRRYIYKIFRKFNKLGLGDPQFLERFPTECPSRIWEMYLAFVFDRWHWKLVPPRKRGQGPDFGIDMGNGSVMWVEATAPTSGQTPANRPPEGDRFSGAALDRTLSLRYLSAISEKLGQFERAQRNGLVDEGDGYCIAISGSQLPRADLDEGPDPPRIVKALFGLGRMTTLLPVGDTHANHEPGPILAAASRTKLTDDGATAIPADLFSSSEVPAISAVLFSPNHIKNRPKRPGRDFVLVRNPYAYVPFPPGQMKAGEEWGYELTGRKMTARNKRPFFAIYAPKPWKQS